MSVSLAPGVMLAGRYRVLNVLGRPGGFGLTYLAWDDHRQQRVAIKEYLPRRFAHRAPQCNEVSTLSSCEVSFRQGAARFMAEARAVAALHHPAVVRVFGAFASHGTAYQVMEYYEGRSLGDHLDGMPDGCMSPVAAVRLLAPVLDGLAMVHRHRIAHCDVKPHNLYLTDDERLILLDFGAALLPMDALTAARVPALSEGYAALEQYRREGPVGPATDVYGISATLYRMVTGCVPPPALDRLGDDPLARESPSGIAALDAVLRAGLELQVQTRIASIAVFRQRLLTAMDMQATQRRA